MSTNNQDKIDQLYIQVQLVVESLKRLERTIDGLSKSDISHRVDIATLKTKSAFWGGLSGGIMTFVIGLLLHLFTKAP